MMTAHTTMQTGQGASRAKALATCQARAAMLGVTLHALPDNGGRTEYIATRWALTKSFSELAEVEAWLVRLEGAAR